MNSLWDIRNYFGSSTERITLYIWIHLPTMPQDSRLHTKNWQPAGRKWSFWIYCLHVKIFKRILNTIQRLLFIRINFRTHRVENSLSHFWLKLRTTAIRNKTIDWHELAAGLLRFIGDEVHAAKGEMIAREDFNLQWIDSWTEWVPSVRLKDVESGKLSALAG